MDPVEFNSIVDGLVKRLELLRAYGVVDAPVAAERIIVLTRSGGEAPRVAFVAPAADGATREETPFTDEERGLVERIIKAMDLEPSDVCILGVARSSFVQDTGVFRDFSEEIEEVSPGVIVTLGREATAMVLKNDAPFADLRGRLHRLGSVKLIPTHHPSGLIENPELKRETWEDVKKVLGELHQGG
jgi:uracil-DNA glycosylase family 4